MIQGNVPVGEGMGAFGAFSVWIFCFVDPCEETLVTKERTFQVHTKCWHLSIANQMGIKYLKLKGLDILDLIAF